MYRKSPWTVVPRAEQSPVGTRVWNTSLSATNANDLCQTIGEKKFLEKQNHAKNKKTKKTINQWTDTPRSSALERSKNWEEKNERRFAYP
jgi:hypothetical protein